MSDNVWYDGLNYKFIENGLFATFVETVNFLKNSKGWLFFDLILFVH